MTINCLTLHQPWASLIAVGAKPFETRSWAPHPPMIGRPIAIHAGKTPIPETLPEAEEIAEALALPRASWHRLPFGAVVCTGTLAGAYQVDRHDWVRDRVEFLVQATIPGSVPMSSTTGCRFGDFQPDRWCWHIVDIRPLEPPVSIDSHLGVWAWDPDAGDP